MVYNSRTSKRDYKQCVYCYGDMNPNNKGCSNPNCKNYKPYVKGASKMKYFVSDKCPFCNKDYVSMGLETVGDVLQHDKICKENPKNKEG